jgi:hypothetical protein
MIDILGLNGSVYIAKKNGIYGFVSHMALLQCFFVFQNLKEAS